MDSNTNKPGSRPDRQGARQGGANIDQPQQSQREEEGMEDTDLSEEESDQERNRPNQGQRQAQGGKSGQQGGTQPSEAQQSQQGEEMSGQQRKHRPPQDEY